MSLCRRRLPSRSARSALARACSRDIWIARPCPIAWPCCHPLRLRARPRWMRTRPPTVPLAPLLATPHGALAASDARLEFPAAAEVFSCSAALDITMQGTPHLYTLLRRTLVDAGLATYGAGPLPSAPRPFVVDKESTCSPQDEPRLVKDGSDPSGHERSGWGWALVLAELMPERSDALIPAWPCLGPEPGGVRRALAERDRGRRPRDGRRRRGAPARRSGVPCADAAAAGENRALRASGRGTTRQCAAEAEALKLR